jgi:hypothetical protein
MKLTTGRPNRTGVPIVGIGFRLRACRGPTSRPTPRSRRRLDSEPRIRSGDAVPGGSIHVEHGDPIPSGTAGADTRNLEGAPDECGAR